MQITNRLFTWLGIRDEFEKGLLARIDAQLAV
jgi:hypothetical protein